MKYDSGTGDLENWIVTETEFDPQFQGKCEAIFCQGNGYLGTRHATEETYIGQVRNTFVAGTFNKADEREVTELPNAADVSAVELFVNNKRFSLENGTCLNYQRTLNLKNGEVIRSFDWEHEGYAIRFRFKRFVSKADLHTIASDISMEVLKGTVDLRILSGINGQLTNTGAQHFLEGEKRIFEGQQLQMLQRTNQSGIDFVHNTTHVFEQNGVQPKSRFELDRRKVYMVYEAKLNSGQRLAFTKISNVFTSRDQDVANLDLADLRLHSTKHLTEQASKRYEELLKESSISWEHHWSNMSITIDSQNDFDQLAIRFAQYHLLSMAPAHDSRLGIAAKGLSGEGYKGHSFWDTEIFILPFFTYTFPEIGKSLLKYRFNTLEGAHKKAKENGYKGAMYPWESAWADDGEVTPVWGAVDIITGEATKIWSGFIEQHITSDVAFGVWQYFMVTGDHEFMKNYGYEILLDTGIFWGSRLDWNEEEGTYHINDVVGPDEYKEHVNNDAFTNHTAKWCMDNAIEYYDHLKTTDQKTFDRLNKKLQLDDEILELRGKVEKLYVPQPNEDLIIPQDDTYLTLKEIDLTKYKNQTKVGTLFQDYNLHQVNGMQVSKQASVVMLMYLLEHRFTKAVKQANYDYYEARTLHDSSLSLSTHAILAADLGNTELSYSLFKNASEIDLGPGMKTSDHGIHAASLGGIWQIIVCGFGGVRMIGGELLINPALPDEINEINFPFYWQGNRVEVSASKDEFVVANKGNEAITFRHQNEDIVVSPGVDQVISSTLINS